MNRLEGQHKQCIILRTKLGHSDLFSWSTRINAPLLKVRQANYDLCEKSMKYRTLDYSRT